MADSVPESTIDAVFPPCFEERYSDCCRRHGVLPNPSLLSSFLKAEVKKACHQLCSLVIFLDDLKDADFPPLFDIFMEIDTSEIDAVDIYHDSSCDLNGEYVLLLLRAIGQKLRVVDLQDVSFGKEFLRDLSQRGLMCRVLNLKSSHFRKLNMVGNFIQLCTLNLDFSSSLTGFRQDCFTCMPNLKSLSLCETRITNLWTTSFALIKLPLLVELRFQNCLCYDESTGYPGSSGGAAANSDLLTNGLYIGGSFIDEDYYKYLTIEEAYIDDELQSISEDSTDDSELDFSNCNKERSLLDALSSAIPGWNRIVDMQNEISYGKSVMQNEETSSSSSNSRHISSCVPKKYNSCHASPICYERHYREYMIASLPGLEVLDDIPIRKADRDRAKFVFSQHFEYLPYKRKNKESIVNVLQNREIKACCTRSKNSRKTLHSSAKSQCFYSRSLSAAKAGSSAWPLLHPLSISGRISGDESRNFRPRQFEYHPSDASLMAFGTLDGEVVVINHENENIVSYIPSLGAMNSVLGLCWLKKYPSMLIAGSDNGSLKLYDTKHILTGNKGIHSSATSVTFDEFDQLTSVHVNSTDEWFLASGYSKNVALYDIGCGRCLQVFTDMHREHINVVKFSNHSPSIFATSSFDQDVKLWDLRQKPIFPCYTASSSRGNVMVCFSPDDHYLLVSAVDNEVKQLLAADGRLHLDFNIGPTGSSQNYTRSYYMNGRDYIISGSCDENVVRICCAQTGKRLRDLSLEGKGAGASMFVQSLRGDPLRDFNMSILAAYVRPSSNSEIVKVNLLASCENAREYFDYLHSRTPYCMGG
ncbi:hypothetical protein NMG60_11021216 [Bertholletia excelsa]